MKGNPLADPFFSTTRAISRLKEEYNAHRRLIVAFDFDDTVFDYHKKGRTYERVIELLRECKQFGFYLVMFTCSDRDKWAAQLDYMKGLGIEVDSVNQNPIPLPFGHDGKVYFNVLLDDRAGLGQAYEALYYTLMWIKAEQP